MEQAFTIHCNHHKDRSAEYLDKGCCEFICNECYNAKDPLEEIPIAMIKIQPIIQRTMRLMRLKSYQAAMAQTKKEISQIIDGMLNSINAEDEVICKEFKNKKEVELSSVMIGAIKKDKNIVGFDKKCVEALGDKIKSDLNLFNEKAVGIIKECSNMAGKVDSSVNSNSVKANTKKETSALKQLNAISEVEREIIKKKEKPKAFEGKPMQASHTVKPIKTKELVIEELRQLYKPNNEIGKMFKRKFD